MKEIFTLRLFSTVPPRVCFSCTFYWQVAQWVGAAGCPDWLQTEMPLKRKMTKLDWSDRGLVWWEAKNAGCSYCDEVASNHVSLEII